MALNVFIVVALVVVSVADGCINTLLLAPALSLELPDQPGVCGSALTGGQRGWRRAGSCSHRLPLCVSQILDADWDDLWDQFDERRYLNAKKWRVGDDPYKLYAFNQRESERIASNRAIPDTRHLRYLLFCTVTSCPSLQRCPVPERGQETACC